MPVLDGYEAVGWSRQKGYSGLIIALTQHEMANDREKLILTIQNQPHQDAIPV